MIEELGIRDLGVIAQATLPIGRGFTAITGETGAGKTMVVTALGLLLGERSEAAVVRTGASQAVVEGRWLVPANGAVAERVRDAGGDLDEVGACDPAGLAGAADSDAGALAELVLGRTVSAEGRSRASAGGRGVPAGVLAELGGSLVVVHGQSDQLRLRGAAAQREALDGFGGAELLEARQAYLVAWRDWRASTEELDSLTSDREARLSEAEDLRIALVEIEALDPRQGEDLELAAVTERLGNLEALQSAAAEALAAVSGGDDSPDAVGLTQTARRAIERHVAHDQALVPVLDAAVLALESAHELASALRGYLEQLDAGDVGDLDALQERRAALAALARRYGPSLDEVLAFASTGGLRLLELEGDDDRLVGLRARSEQAQEAVRAAAERLSSLRRSAADRLAASVTAELAELAMPEARLEVAVRQSELGESGGDEVEILLVPHPGAPARPISRGASGGELSRLMLAMEVVLAESGTAPTFVFDEVDAGVGGASAIEIGRRLARLAERTQVVVVTHLAQVAAFAGTHLTIVKSASGGVTASDVREVTGPERAAELARMLSGLADSESGLAHARELLELAARPRAGVTATRRG